jgi:hypothetical protein
VHVYADEPVPEADLLELRDAVAPLDWWNSGD